ncbi:hypothetical protein ACJJTC_014547, partial [Scirpophaga incertulas]
SEQSSPFRRWTTGSGAGSSYRHHDHRNMYNKQMSEGSPSGGAASGGVARWSLGLEQLLADPAGAAAFAHFLAKEFAAENIRFWWLCEQYSVTEDANKRLKLANEIWQRHLADGASDPVNVDAAARRAVELRRSQQPLPRDLFTQLKKSASNASERRRSGGPSLLPWKLRAPSKDREERPPPTDVVKSSQSSGQCSLCRVVLPDGATSVVGVDANVTVGQLVERLMMRRNLPTKGYEVLLRDAAK